MGQGQRSHWSKSNKDPKQRQVDVQVQLQVTSLISSRYFKHWLFEILAHCQWGSKPDSHPHNWQKCTITCICPFYNFSCPPQIPVCDFIRIRWETAEELADKHPKINSIMIWLLLSENWLHGDEHPDCVWICSYCFLPGWMDCSCCPYDDGQFCRRTPLIALQVTGMAITLVF